MKQCMCVYVCVCPCLFCVHETRVAGKRGRTLYYSDREMRNGLLLGA